MFTRTRFSAALISSSIASSAITRQGIGVVVRNRLRRFLARCRRACSRRPPPTAWKVLPSPVARTRRFPRSPCASRDASSSRMASAGAAVARALRSEGSRFRRGIHRISSIRARVSRFQKYFSVGRTAPAKSTSRSSTTRSPIGSARCWLAVWLWSAAETARANRSCFSASGRARNASKRFRSSAGFAPSASGVSADVSAAAPTGPVACCTPRGAAPRLGGELATRVYFRVLNY